MVSKWYLIREIISQTFKQFKMATDHTFVHLLKSSHTGFISVVISSVKWTSVSNFHLTGYSNGSRYPRLTFRVITCEYDFIWSFISDVLNVRAVFRMRHLFIHFLVNSSLAVYHVSVPNFLRSISSTNIRNLTRKTIVYLFHCSIRLIGLLFSL